MSQLGHGTELERSASVAGSDVCVLMCVVRVVCEDEVCSRGAEDAEPKP